MFKYSESLTQYKRFKSRTVHVGDIPLGSEHPIRIQSMTTTNTLDIDATVKQSIKIIKAGSDYVRITAPSIKEAKVLKDIKNKIREMGYRTPIIADIHFTPNAAIEAAQIVEKVRINPGNYADKKKFLSFEYTDIEYSDELDRIYNRFSPLVKMCKVNGTAMRIGTNHGSLSDRIMNRYGDTPEGMVESAMEFLRICEDHNYYDLVLSMKSSNPIVMVQAYRLLVSEMMKMKMNYPIHLGVTEAGEGIEGRIKSSLGIGTLLEDGIGDTIRVSLTEEPEHEIPVAKNILSRYSNKINCNETEKNVMQMLNPFEYERRFSISINNIGGDNVPIVIADLSSIEKINLTTLENFGFIYSKNSDKWIIKDFAVDYIFIGDNDIDFELPEQLGAICTFNKWKDLNGRTNFFPKLTMEEYLEIDFSGLKFVSIFELNLIDDKFLSLVRKDKSAVLIIGTNKENRFLQQRNLFFKLMKLEIKNPVIISKDYQNLSIEQIQINASIDIGGMFVDGLGDGLLISHDPCISFDDSNKLSFQILQSTRTRITKTDYISCPSCGRTQFDLMETTALVREKTSHLKGLKIAVMGCIVNGPGEMADADYGYVGTGFQKISLYKKHNVVKKNINSDVAVDELIKLIKKNGDWVNPQKGINGITNKNFK